MKAITIIGAGLAGTLLGLYLAKRGYPIQIIVSRPDSRLSPPDKGRSINLALSCRGLTGLSGAGLLEEVRALAVPMRGRAIHQEDNTIIYQPFGRDENEYINAIERQELNELLLNQLEKEQQVSITFDMQLTTVDVYKKTLYLTPTSGGDTRPSTYHYLIGADGANSAVRAALRGQALISSAREFLSHGYKELSISSAHADALAREQLHLWPREGCLLLGNPNRNHSITGSLFLANKGELSFESLNNEAQITHFFKTTFPDAFMLMPDVVAEFLHNPIGNMSTIKAEPWLVADNCLLIGDSAHGIVPFFGQGMNCAFEDCRILDTLLTQYDDDWSKAMPAFYEARHVNTDAVAELSMDNYHEIQQGIRYEVVNLKKQLERELMHRYRDRYISKHVLVMFTNTPYAVAQACGELQTELLNKICATIKGIDDVSWDSVDKLMLDYDKKLAEIPSF